MVVLMVAGGAAAYSESLFDRCGRCGKALPRSGARRLSAVDYQALFAIGICSCFVALGVHLIAFCVFFPNFQEVGSGTL
jgi:hypothetical protein